MTNQEYLEANNNKRTKCTVYTRVMGYYRPTHDFNPGKTGEHKQRKHFIEPENCNSCNKDCKTRSADERAKDLEE